jgi:hypothetical protein
MVPATGRFRSATAAGPPSFNLVALRPNGHMGMAAYGARRALGGRVRECGARHSTRRDCASAERVVSDGAAGYLRTLLGDGAVGCMVRGAAGLLGAARGCVGDCRQAETGEWRRVLWEGAADQGRPLGIHYTLRVTQGLAEPWLDASAGAATALLTRSAASGPGAESAGLECFEKQRARRGAMVERCGAVRCGEAVR